MPANKNALIRYKVIDKCLRNKYREWTLDNLVEAVSDAMYEFEGTGVSKRTVQGDIQVMRSDKLGYYAPIEVYDNKYYRYSDPDYSITQMPLSQNDYEVLQEAVEMLKELQEFNQFTQLADVVGKLRDTLQVTKEKGTPVIHYDSVPNLKGLQLLNPLYNHIIHRQSIQLQYRAFNSEKSKMMVVYPHMLKEFRNRWFLFASRGYKKLRLLTLPLDRIECFEPVEDIPYRDNKSFDPEHFFDNVIGVTKNINSKETLITFKATNGWSGYIETKPIHPSQKLIERNDDGTCIFTISVVENPELYSVLFSYDSGIEVLSPEPVREKMRKKVGELAGYYASANF